MMNFKILIIDDEQDILDIYESFLKKQFDNCEVIKARDGLEGLLEAQLQEFNLIISDYKMPVMDGGNFLKYLKERSALNKETPVIISSGYIPDAKSSGITLDDVYLIEKTGDFKKLMTTAKMMIKR